MHCTRKITDDIIWVGANDRRLSRFENLYPLTRGVSYNSYLILDEKTCLMDTMDQNETRQFAENVKYALGGRDLDYLVVQHMEPDHCSSISYVMNHYKNAKVVVNAKTLPMIKQFFRDVDESRFLMVKEMETLELGRHTLTFVMAPMVHWPEVMMTYDSFDKVLFSADGFGTFGTIDGTIFDDEVDFDRDWLDEARRYYTNICGKYGMQVQAALKKAATLDIQILCPLHGIIWRTNPAYFIDKYNIWSTYEPETKGVMIAYASMYGNTENMAEIMAFKLAERGVKVKLYDVSGTDTSWLLSESFHYSHILLASPTYNGGVYPLMDHLLHEMKSHGLKNRTFTFIDNGTWGPVAAKQMAKQVEELKDCTVLNETISIKSALKEDQMGVLDQIADALKASVEA
ncbi:MAG: FprA family A-type flavoprotein [Lachnospiraceae bacterium]|nr:FprA family A-type flavoprotein [Lachnospiraceae bacterium]